MHYTSPSMHAHPSAGGSARVAGRALAGRWLGRLDGSHLIIRQVSGVCATLAREHDLGPSPKRQSDWALQQGAFGLLMAGAFVGIRTCGAAKQVHTAMEGYMRIAAPLATTPNGTGGTANFSPAWPPEAPILWGIDVSSTTSLSSG